MHMLRLDCCCSLIGNTIVGGIFALAILLTAVGFLAAGIATVRARLWQGWRRFTPLTVSRISRVVSVREGPTARPVAQPKPLEGMTPAEQEKVREQFLERFIKRLP